MSDHFEDSGVARGPFGGGFSGGGFGRLGG
jgi:hypothetical protein